MLHKRYKSLLLLMIGAVCAQAQPKQLPYKNPNLPVQTRVDDLLSRMTAEEKIGQLLCPLGWEMYTIKGKDVVPSEKFKQLISERNAGMLWAVYRADPWTKKTLANGLNPEKAAKAGNALQKYVIENTRLGIPMFLAEEAPHGHMAIGTTVFPTGIGLAATWSEALLEEVGRVIGKEVRLQGGHISYGPVLDLTRDPRWSRVEETFGEDPVLSGTLGAAEVRGLGGGKLDKSFATIATLKHFIAYAVPEGGQNGNYSVVTKRDMIQNFLSPFRKAIDAGALSVMTSYNSIDGVPCTANTELYHKILRGDWGFRGFVVSDLYSIEGIHGNHMVASSNAEAALLAAKAGVDVDLGGDAYMNLRDALKDGKISVAVIDSAVSRVLRLKFEMGLFENPYVNPKVAAKEVRSAENVNLARRVARSGIVLLKNNNVLPLDAKKLKRVAVVGPNADNRYNMLGDYTAPQEESNIKTVLDGVLSKLSANAVEYVKGCAVRDTTNTDIDKAVEAARRSDVVIAVVGGSSARDFKTTYKETGAAVADKTVVSDMESGEGFDRATLTLLGKQNELLRALKATGKPLVVVYIEGRPLDKLWASENADALLTAFYPGQQGGMAIADVLFGDYNPAGRLPMTVPRSLGQIPIYYNKKAPLNHDYVEESARPLYAFGYGLSYTSFKYSDLNIKCVSDKKYEVSFIVKNTGSRAGEEVSQLYLHDEYASVVQPLMQLKHFSRFYLQPGEEKKVTFTLDEADFALVNAQYRQVVEPGVFKVMVGASSDDIRLQQDIAL
mgnify:FL=1